ncbi:DinB family protein [Chryseolinea soli]|uniref:DinB family protein n=1 Tax=Chryseolinea soli TaxID=2321403 RepID=A0A385SP95_9BACT|nr:DinB family protein [Chryseolinea soli]AYB33563.1 DinB family protein [Chryseolinea soli]
MNKNELKLRMETVFDHFIHALQQHDDVNRKRADGGWSVGQIANHILKGTDTNLGSTKKTERAYDKNADAIKALFLDFGKKFTNAPDIEPDAKHYTKEDLIVSLRASRDEVFRMIDQEDLTETCVDWELPVWGNLTKYECAILYENHIIRHTKQVIDFNKVTAEKF